MFKYRPTCIDPKVSTCWASRIFDSMCLHALVPGFKKGLVCLIVQFLINFLLAINWL